MKTADKVQNPEAAGHFGPVAAAATLAPPSFNLESGLAAKDLAHPGLMEEGLGDSQPAHADKEKASSGKPGDQGECAQCAGRQPGPVQKVAHNNGVCHGTTRIGNLRWRGVTEHVLIMQDYLTNLNPNAEMEYAIPESSEAGNTGYADLADPVSGVIYEIKTIAGAPYGVAEAFRYAEKAREHCDQSTPWHMGTGYPYRVIQHPDPQKELISYLHSPGVIVYYTRRRRRQPDPQPQPVPLPRREPGFDEQLGNYLRRVLQEGVSAERAAREWLTEHPEVAWTILTLGTIGLIALIADDLVGGFADDVAIPPLLILMGVALQFAF